jgi:phenylpyruvate tautomerase PptA (4-oxalocrotonate tautomerase family)
MEAVHGALVEAFKIKPTDRHVRLIAHEPHRFLCPPGRAKPEASVLISIDALAGRSLDAKRNLYKTIVNNLEPLGIPKDHTKILLREIPTQDWGLRGGQAGCDIDLGYKIDV